MLVKEKVDQALALLDEFDVDCWLTFTRESEVCDLPELGDVEVVFPALHGGAGEDGRVQAVLELRGIPYALSGPVEWVWRRAAHKPLERLPEPASESSQG